MAFARFLRPTPARCSMSPAWTDPHVPRLVLPLDWPRFAAPSPLPMPGPVLEFQKLDRGGVSAKVLSQCSALIGIRKCVV